MGTFLIGLVIGFVIGVLFGRRNQKKVEAALEELKARLKETQGGV